MKWHLRIIAWIADAIKRKAEMEDDNNVEARLGRIEEKLAKIDKSNIPVALFASGISIYLIGFGNSLNNAINAIGIDWDNLMYLVVGSLLITVAMKIYTRRNRDSIITIALTFGILIVINLVNYFRLS